jgi:hypothetical protein
MDQSPGLGTINHHITLELKNHIHPKGWCAARATPETTPGSPLVDSSNLCDRYGRIAFAEKPMSRLGCAS